MILQRIRCLVKRYFIIYNDYTLLMQYGADMSDQDWKDHVRGLLKAELAKRNINYIQLAEILEETFGILESPQNLSNKIARGTFGAIFMIQILEAIGVESLALPSV